MSIPVDRKKIIQSKTKDIISIIRSNWGTIDEYLEDDIKKVKFWLSNFEQDEIPHMLELLKHIFYVDPHESSLLNRIVENILYECSGFLSEIKICSLQKGFAMSGSKYLEPIKKIINQKNSTVLTSIFEEVDDAELAGAKCLILIDDTIGSGQQAIDKLKEWRQKNNKCYYHSIIGSYDGIINIEKEVGVRAFAAHKVDKIFSGKFGFTDREKCESIARYYGEQLYYEREKEKQLKESNSHLSWKDYIKTEKYLQKHRKHSLGYEDSQFLVAYKYSCPNNTLPIIWAGGNNELKRFKNTNWYPLFERVYVAEDNGEKTVKISNNNWFGSAIPDISSFKGRTKELKILEKWIFEENCRVLSILGIRGIGKTDLSISLGKGGIGKSNLSYKFAKSNEEKFDKIVWHSLINLPPLEDVLLYIIKILSSNKDISLPQSENAIFEKVISYIQTSKVLIVFDNYESIMKGDIENNYNEGYENYGRFIDYFAKFEHKGVLLITSREKPKEVSISHGNNYAIREFRLDGLDTKTVKRIYKDIGVFRGTNAAWYKLKIHYSGNPLALKTVADHIRSLYSGNIDAFINSTSKPFLNDLLDWHFNRLSETEKSVIFLLTINRNYCTIDVICDDLKNETFTESPQMVLQSLSQKMLIEKSAEGFYLQPFIMEYFTHKLLYIINQEILSKNISFFDNIPLLKTTSIDYIKKVQKRILVLPLIHLLRDSIGHKNDIIKKSLLKIIAQLRTHSRYKLKYVVGNVINIISNLDRDEPIIKNVNFSKLPIYHADLTSTRCHNVDFTNCEFDKTSFLKTFGMILSMRFNPCNNILATGSGNGEIQLWNIDKSEYKVLKGHNSWVVAVCFSKDGKLLASGSNDRTLIIWDVENLKPIKSLDLFRSSVRSVSFHPNRPQIAGGSEDKTVRIWNFEIDETDNYKELIFNNAVRTVSYNNKGDKLYCGCDDGNIYEYDSVTYELTNKIKAHDGWVRSIALSRDDKTLISGGSDKYVKVWNIENKIMLLNKLEGHKSDVMVVSMNSDNIQIASCSNDTSIRIWNFKENLCKFVFSDHNSWVRALNYNSTENILASGSDDSTIKLWDTREGYCISSWTSYSEPIWSMISNNMKRLYIGGGTNYIYIWDDKFNLTHRFFAHKQRIWGVSGSPNGKYFASVGDDFCVCVWNTDSFTKAFSFNHEKRLWSVSFNATSSILATAGEDGVRIWDIHQNKPINHINNISVRSVKFHPKENILAIAGEDGIIRIWNHDENRLEDELQGHDNCIWCTCFNSDGTLLANAGDGNKVIIWEKDKKDLKYKRYKTVDKLKNTQIRSLLFDSDNKSIYIAGSNSKIELWNFKEDKVDNVLDERSRWIWSLIHDLSTENIVSSGEDNVLRVWNKLNKECRIIRIPRPYEKMIISDISGLDENQIQSLISLGAINK